MSQILKKAKERALNSTSEGPVLVFLPPHNVKFLEVREQDLSSLCPSIAYECPSNGTQCNQIDE